MYSADGVDRLKQLIRNISQSRLSYQAQANFGIEDIAAQPQMYFYWLAQIAVTDPSLQIRFNIHFKTSNAKYLASPLYNLSPEKLRAQQAFDCMREYCNLTAGGLKKALLPITEMHIGLPVTKRGLPELFRSGLQVPMAADRWRLKNQDLDFICSSRIDFSKGVDFSKIHQLTEKLPDPAGVEFL